MTSNQVVIREVSFNLPFGIGGVKWGVDETQTRAAWSLYVELVTRIAVEPLQEDQGLVREALNSLYSLFGTTREILKDAGPNVGASINSVGGIAIAVLNLGLRPFLAKWHPLLQVYEAKRPSDIRGLSSNCTETYAKAVLLAEHSFQLLKNAKSYIFTYHKSKSSNSSIASTSRSGRNAPSFNSSGKLN